MRAAAAVKDVVKRYAAENRAETIALDGVTLSIDAGEMVALMGPSGCGKSTLLNLIGCVDVPTTGEVIVDGESTAGLRDDRLTRLRRDRIGTVFQFFNLLPALTLAENVALPLRLARAPGRIAEARALAALDAAGIGDLASAYPAQVSGGQMQRAAIARAIVAEPAIVLADEPTGNLDSRSGAAILALLREVASAGRAVLMATHSPQAAAICDRTVRMQDGRIVQPVN